MILYLVVKVPKYWLKFADEITVPGLITNSDESEYRDQVNKRISWGQS